MSEPDWCLEHPESLRVEGIIGEDFIGQVIKVVDDATDGGKKHYTLKRVRQFSSRPGRMRVPYCRRILREVEILSLLKGCPYILPLNMIYLSADKRDLYMLAPFIDYDLESVVRRTVLREEEIKWITYQILVGISHVHRKKLMHGDLKLRNILISDECDTYITDFGLSAAADEMSRGDDDYGAIDVVTLEYRAPELLLQFKNFDSRVDMWSAGCILAELYLRRRLLVPERRDLPHQLLKLVRVFGKPDLEFVNNHASPSAANFLANIIKKFEARQQQQAESGDTAANIFDQPIAVQLASAGASQGAIDLISGLLQFDFRRRLPAAQALKMPWFADDEDYQSMEGVADAPAGAHEPGSPLDSGAALRTEDGEIVDAHESLREIQRADIEELKALAERKATKIEKMVRAEYGAAENENVLLSLE